ASNNASSTSTAAFTVTPDTTAPTSQSAAVTGGYYTSLSVPVSLANGSDSGSGIDASSAVVLRASATLTNGSCGSYGSYQPFTVTAATDDSESGIQNVAFPALAGITGGGTVTSSPYQQSYSWTASSSASGAQTATASNNAGLTAGGDFTVTPDTAAPTGQNA